MITSYAHAQSQMDGLL